METCFLTQENFYQGSKILKANVWSPTRYFKLLGVVDAIPIVLLFITCRAKLLNADWLRQRAFFLNQEGTFGNQGHDYLMHACIKLVSRFKRILKRNFRNASLLSLILHGHFILTWTKINMQQKRSLLVEKQKDFSDQKRIDSQPVNSFLSGDGWC